MLPGRGARQRHAVDDGREEDGAGRSTASQPARHDAEDVAGGEVGRDDGEDGAPWAVLVFGFPIAGADEEGEVVAVVRDVGPPAAFTVLDGASKASWAVMKRPQAERSRSGQFQRERADVMVRPAAMSESASRHRATVRRGS